MMILSLSLLVLVTANLVSIDAHIIVELRGLQVSVPASWHDDEQSTANARAAMLRPGTIDGDVRVLTDPKHQIRLSFLYTNRRVAARPANKILKEYFSECPKKLKNLGEHILNSNEHTTAYHQICELEVSKDQRIAHSTNWGAVSKDSQLHLWSVECNYPKRTPTRKSCFNVLKSQSWVGKTDWLKPLAGKI